MRQQIEQLAIKEDALIRDAMACIDQGALGVAFVVNEEFKLLGIITDGDVRRALLAGSEMNSSVAEATRKNFVSMPVYSSNIEILEKLSDRIKVIPLVDKNNRLVDYASHDNIRKIAVASPLLGGNELLYVTNCIKTNWISSQGKYVQMFEKQFEELHSERKALAVSNGTVALHLALDALGIGAGDEVILPNLTFAATINAIIYTGATPVLVDVDQETWNIDPAQIESAITPKTKAILIVHLYGQPCEMNVIGSIAKRNNLLLIEDCAEAIGSTYFGKPVGTFGDAATFSFFGNKTITTGEGGMVLFKSNEVFERGAVLRDHGMSKKKRYWHEFVGYNYRLTNLQAAVGVAQMENIDAIIAGKLKIGTSYREGLDSSKGFIHPAEKHGIVNTFWLYTVLLSDDAPFTRDEFMDYLSEKGIESRPVFYPLHSMPLYQKFGNQKNFPISSKIASRGISLPSSSSISEKELNYINDQIMSFGNSKATLIK